MLKQLATSTIATQAVSAQDGPFTNQRGARSSGGRSAVAEQPHSGHKADATWVGGVTGRMYGQGLRTDARVARLVGRAGALSLPP